MADTIETQTGTRARRTSLPEQYLTGTGNSDPRAVTKLVDAGPTQLGYRAVQNALKSCGLHANALSAIIADCGTPYQVCPSEAQRIGSKLGVKVPAYDLFTTAGPIPTHLSELSSWKETHVPEYTALVASNTPTHRVNYRAGHESFLFGDGAGCLIVSTRHPGKLAVKEAQMFSRMGAPGSISFDVYDFAIVPSSAEHVMFDLAHEAGTKAVAAAGRPASDLKFIGPEVLPTLDSRLAQKLGISAQNHWSMVADVGNTLSSGPLITLANHWDQLAKGDTVVCVQVGVGLSYGFVIFECMH